MGDILSSSGNWNDKSIGEPSSLNGVGDAAPLKVDTVETNLAFVHVEHLHDGVSVAVANKRGEVVAGMMVGADVLAGTAAQQKDDAGEIFALWDALHEELLSGPCEYVITTPAYLKLAAIMDEARILFLPDDER